MPPERVILAFDTSAAHCAAALLCGDRLIEARSEEMGKGQAERLMPMLEEMLARAALGWRDLSALAVGVGPGNFTGVRLSVAAARGLSLAIGRPAIGVSALEAWAYGLPRPVLIALDARRGQVYLQRFDAGRPSEPMLAAFEALPAWVFGAGLVTGDAAAEVAAATDGPRLAGPAMPLAEAVARIALSRIDTPQPRPAPLYLRAADAAPPRDPAPELLP